MVLYAPDLVETVNVQVSQRIQLVEKDVSSLSAGDQSHMTSLTTVMENQKGWLEYRLSSLTTAVEDNISGIQRVSQFNGSRYIQTQLF